MRAIDRVRWPLLVVVGLAPWLGGCQGGDGPAPTAERVVVYVALDREFSEPILEGFEKSTGIEVLAKYDTESTKSVGLTELIRTERERPRCDVFWNNEIVNTLRLAEEDLLAPYSSPTGNEYPEGVRSQDELWYGFAARARVLLVNTEKVALDDAPRGLRELAAPKWRGQFAIAKPLFGTTATHVACLFALLGPADAKALLQGLLDNEVVILPGNKQVAVEVGAGSVAMGLTDTDDALAEIRQGRPVEMILLDAHDDGLGMLLLPNTLAFVKGGPNPGGGEKLIDYLLSQGIEAKLATGKSGQIPLHPKNADEEIGVDVPKDAKRMPVRFEDAEAQWEAAQEFVKQKFTGP